MIHHVWRQFAGRNADEDRRNELARSSWMGMLSVPVRATNLPRLYDEPPLQLPFVRDVFDFGVRNLKDDAMVLFTATDVGLATTASHAVERALAKAEAGDAFRHLFPEGLRQTPTDGQIAAAQQDPGRGMWFFQARWWRKYREVFPDVLLPRAAWDYAMLILLNETVGIGRKTLSGLCWHQEHPRLYHESSMHGNRHNLTLIRRFFHEHGWGHMEQHLCPAAFGLDYSEPYKA